MSSEKCILDFGRRARRIKIKLKLAPPQAGDLKVLIIKVGS